MANAVFNSTETYFMDHSNRPNVPRSKFDLSHIRSFDCDFGCLVPFYLEDCLPNDDFKISNVIKVQTLPLRNPLLNNIRVYTYYYYVPYYLLWHKFDRFLSGGRDGTYTAELPYVKLYDYHYFQSNGSDTYVSRLFGHNSLMDYMGFPICSMSRETVDSFYYKISAFPFAAYQRIYRDYFQSQDHQTDTNVNDWYPEDDFDFSLHSGECFYMGIDDNKEDYTSFNDVSDFSDPWLLTLRWRNYRKDYFTSALFSPQRGPAQAVPIVGTFNLDTSDMFYNRVDDTDAPADGQFVSLARISGSDDNVILPYLDKGGTYSNGRRVSVANDYVKQAFSRLAINSFGNTAGFTISDLRFAVQVQRWLERNMLVKAQYNEFLRIHFNDAPLDERLTKPYYIGGTVQNVKVAEVLQTSESSATPQGHLTGSGFSMDSQFVGRFHSHEYGLILGLLCIMPDPYYAQGIDCHWTKTSRYNFYFPEFADLEPRAILNQEIFASWVEDNVPVFGYIGYGDEYRHHRSLAVGSLRNPNQADWFSWTITRNFASTPSLNSNAFICTSRHGGNPSCPSWHVADGETVYDSTVRHDAFTSGFSVNPFIVQVGISCTAIRPLPYVSNPVNAEI